MSDTIHELKTDPEVWDAVASGSKTFEIRKDDRGYRVGDVLLLRRTKYTGAEMQQGKPLEYGGKIRMTISHILRGPIYGLQDGWVIMSLDSITALTEQLRKSREETVLLRNDLQNTQLEIISCAEVIKELKKETATAIRELEFEKISKSPLVDVNAICDERDAAVLKWLKERDKYKVLSDYYQSQLLSQPKGKEDTK